MPYFLDTDTGELVSHGDPKTIVYAILSHTWQDVEQTFADIQRIQDTVSCQFRQLQLQLKTAASGAELLEAQRECWSIVAREVETLGSIRPSLVMPRYRPRTGCRYLLPRHPSILFHSELSDKIRGICKIARDAGYRYVWIDTCCIDKASSAELSEAINSMYEWYRLADICYVYLPDVPDGIDPRPQGSLFWKSKWHTRGWTLQELIAPEHVVFLNAAWTSLGTKVGMAATLEKITGVAFQILTHQITLSAVSVARRLSWAAKRQTTRVEDKAYALLGIFGIHMSPIYGEGINAFLRLQEEIIKTIPDQSIFGWGFRASCALVTTGQANPLFGDVFTRDTYRGPSLLAEGPEDFSDVADLSPLSPADFAKRLGRREEDVPPLHCVLTPEGFRVSLLCIDISRTPQILTSIFLSLGWHWPCTNGCKPAHALALLRCKDRDGSLLALPLCRVQDSTATSGGWLAIATHDRCFKWNHARQFRVVRLGQHALKTLLDADPISTPVPVTLLRHRRTVPKPKTREDSFALIPGIPQLRDSSPLFVCLSPENQRVLRKLGFTLTLDQGTRAGPADDPRLVLRLSLVSDSTHVEWKRGAQRIELEIVIERTGKVLERPDTLVKFSVTNLIHSFPVSSEPENYTDAESEDAASNAEGVEGIQEDERDTSVGASISDDGADRADGVGVDSGREAGGASSNDRVTNTHDTSADPDSTDDGIGSQFEDVEADSGDSVDHAAEQEDMVAKSDSGSHNTAMTDDRVDVGHSSSDSDVDSDCSDSTGHRVGANDEDADGYGARRSLRGGTASSRSDTGQDSADFMVVYGAVDAGSDGADSEEGSEDANSSLGGRSLEVATQASPESSGPAASFQEAPCVGNKDVFDTFHAKDTAARVLAAAAFVVHADDRWKDDDFDLRFLQIRLERPMHASMIRDNGCLLVSVELSERYHHRRPAQDIPQNPGHGAEDPDETAPNCNTSDPLPSPLHSRQGTGEVNAVAYESSNIDIPPDHARPEAAAARLGAPSSEVLPPPVAPVVPPAPDTTLRLGVGVGMQPEVMERFVQKLGELSAGPGRETDATHEEANALRAERQMATPQVPAHAKARAPRTRQFSWKAYLLLLLLALYPFAVIWHAFGGLLMLGKT